MKIYRIPIDCVMKPPATGPTAGPIRGIRLYTAIADARSRSEKRSLTVPPPMAIGVAPENPAVKVVVSV